MDGSLFDAVSRHVSGCRTRRAALRALGGLFVAGGVGHLAPAEAPAKRAKDKPCPPCRKKKDGKCNKGKKPDGTPCGTGKVCLSGKCRVDPVI